MEDLIGISARSLLQGILVLIAGAGVGLLVGNSWSAAVGGAFLGALAGGCAQWVQGELEASRGRKLLAARAGPEPEPPRASRSDVSADVPNRTA